MVSVPLSDYSRQEMMSPATFLTFYQPESLFRNSFFIFNCHKTFSSINI